MNTPTKIVLEVWMPPDELDAWEGRRFGKDAEGFVRSIDQAFKYELSRRLAYLHGERAMKRRAVEEGRVTEHPAAGASNKE